MGKTKNQLKVLAMKVLESAKQRIKRNRKAQLKEKRLHGQFIRDTEEVADEKSWNWIRNGHLKRETESMAGWARGSIGISVERKVS